MEPNAAPDAEIARRFAAIRRRQKVLVYLAISLAVAVIVTQLASTQIDAATGMMWLASVLTLFLLVALIVVIVRAAINWRCPACGQPLGRAADTCKECGTKLRD